MASLDATHPARDGLKVKIVDVKEALAKRNPDAPAAEIESAGRLIAAFAEAVVSLSLESKRALLAHRAKIAPGVDFLVTQLEREFASKAFDDNATHGRRQLAPRLSERVRGAGLGETVSAAEGRRRLAAFATPLALEDWAGPVMGPSELEREFGIKRSTLQDWRRVRAVIGLLKGVRKHVFPVAQFVDGRPVRGLAELQDIIGDPRTAWLWLVEPATNEDRTPLARLKRGEVDGVLEAAREDFA